jgi:hypothetical protein
MKLVIIQFSPASCHFIPHQSKCFPQHPVFKYPQLVIFPIETKFDIHTKLQENYSYVYFNFYIFRERKKREKSCKLHGIKHYPNLTCS